MLLLSDAASAPAVLPAPDRVCGGESPRTCIRTLDTTTSLVLRWAVRRRAPRPFLIVAAAIVLLLALVRLRFGGGERLEDRTTDPELPPSALEEVVSLGHPPGNIAVSPDGRIFFTLHPDGDPPTAVHELRDGKPVPYPDASFQPGGDAELAFTTPLAVRVDRQNRLWVLDHAGFAREQPRLVAFDLATGEVVHRHDFPSDVAGLLSMVNDFQVDPAGETIYIAEASPILQTPALLVHDVASNTTRRVLDGHDSVEARDFLLQAPGRDMQLFGLYSLRIPVDSIALDREGEWLYYGPLTGDRLFRVRTRDLRDASLSPEDLAARVEDYGPKTISDGITTDVEGNVYLSDPEHSAVLTLGPDRKLVTLVKDERLRWPDGFSFGPDGWLYVTASSLQHVLFMSEAHRDAHAPYHIFRFKPGPAGVPGH